MEKGLRRASGPVPSNTPSVTYSYISRLYKKDKDQRRLHKIVLKSLTELEIFEGTQRFLGANISKKFECLMLFVKNLTFAFIHLAIQGQILPYYLLCAEANSFKLINRQIMAKFAIFMIVNFLSFNYTIKQPTDKLLFTFSSEFKQILNNI